MAVCLPGLLLGFPLSLQFLLSGCLMAFNCQTLKKNAGEGESPRRHWQAKWQLRSRLLHAPMKTCQHHLGQFAVTIGEGGGGGGGGAGINFPTVTCKQHHCLSTFRCYSKRETECFFFFKNVFAWYISPNIILQQVPTVNTN